MLASIELEDFKSYRSGRLTLSPITVLIGANASGKSNALEALRLLSWISKGNKLNAVKYAIQEGDSVVRGRVRDLPHHGKDRFRFTCYGPFSSGVPSPSSWTEFSIQLASTVDDELYIVDERVVSNGSTVPLYEVIERQEQVGHDLIVAYNNFSRGGRKPKVACMDQQAVFIQLESSARYAASHRLSARIIPRVSQNLQNWLGGIHFLDPSPSAMRNYSFKTEHSLQQNGANLSGVLYNICQNEAGREALLSFIRSLPEQDIAGISFIETQRGEVMVQLTETFGGESQTVDAALLSDGTLRVLSIAAAILSSEKGGLIVVEEIDNGVHPARAKLLLDRVAEQARLRDIRILISSHNPALLDALPDPYIGDVVFCYRDPSDGSSRLTKLSDIDRFPELISQGGLGGLLTKGLIERYAKDRDEQKRRVRRSLDWLKSVGG